jgi:hypothetical protein
VHRSLSTRLCLSCAVAVTIALSPSAPAVVQAMQNAAQSMTARSRHVSPDNARTAERHHGSVAKLRHALGVIFAATKMHAHLSARAVCSQASIRGQLAIIELLEGQERYLASRTCENALTETEREWIGNRFPQCDTVEDVAAVDAIVKGARVHTRGKRATVELANDIACGGDGAGTAPNELSADRLAVTHWTERHGHWLFDDEPTGTYTAAGQKSAALLRAALTGGTITENVGILNDAAAFCANGDSHITFANNFIPNGGTWYVAGGYSVASNPRTLRAPFDAHGNPQGAVFIFQPIAVEWGLTLVAGTVVASQPAEAPVTGNLAFQPGNAGC